MKPNQIAIHYKAWLTWMNDDETISRRYCDVTHVIDTQTLQTVSFEYEPIQEQVRLQSAVEL